MAITVDQATLGNAVGAAISGTIVLTTTAAVAAGATIIVCAGCDGANQPASCADSGSNVYTLDKVATNGTSNDRVALFSAYIPAGLASGQTITVTFSGSPPGRMIGAMSFLGVESDSASRIEGTPLSATQATAAWSSGSYATTVSTVIVAAAETDTATTNTATAPSVETQDMQEASSGNSLCMEYRIEVLGSSYTVAGTWAGAAAGVEVAVAYKEAGAGGGGAPGILPDFMRGAFPFMPMSTYRDLGEEVGGFSTSMRERGPGPYGGF